jgi:hypothetical protein
MLRVLKLVPAFGVPRPAAGLGPARRFVRAVLLRLAARAVALAARLERVEAPEQAVQLEVIRPYAGIAVGVRFAEVVVYLALAAYFVAGLVGVFVA